MSNTVFGASDVKSMLKTKSKHIFRLHHNMHGSPQGCILCLLLFIFYINGCCSNKGQYLVKFSDDTALLTLLRGSVDTHSVALAEFIAQIDVNF